MGYCCPKSITTYKPAGNLEVSRRLTGQSKVFVGVVWICTKWKLAYVWGSNQVNILKYNGWMLGSSQWSWFSVQQTCRTTRKIALAWIQSRCSILTDAVLNCLIFVKLLCNIYCDRCYTNELNWGKRWIK